MLHKTPNKSVNPDEVVAVGAALQGGVLAGEVKDVLLLDVTPLSLGVETMGGVMTRLIERNTTIPVQKSEIFSTAADNQNAVDIHILQGERPMAQDNMTLGHFRLEGIAPAPRGVPQIEVQFDIDANGILNVTATDKATGKVQQITVTASTNLKSEDVERLVKEASRNQLDDEKRHNLAKARNEADTVIYQAEKILNDTAIRMSDSDRAAVQEQIKTVRKHMEGTNAVEISEAVKSLEQTVYTLAQQAASRGSQSHQPESEDTIEGEFTPV